jgi:hypothetical protein
VDSSATWSAGMGNSAGGVTACCSLVGGWVGQAARSSAQAGPRPPAAAAISGWGETRQLVLRHGAEVWRLRALTLYWATGFMLGG